MIDHYRHQYTSKHYVQGLRVTIALTRQSDPPVWGVWHERDLIGFMRYDPIKVQYIAKIDGCETYAHTLTEALGVIVKAHLKGITGSTMIDRLIENLEADLVVAQQELQEMKTDIDGGNDLPEIYLYRLESNVKQIERKIKDAKNDKS